MDARKLEFTGVFFDGRSPQKQRVSIALSPRQLTLTPQAGKPLNWQYANLKLRASGGPAKAPFHIEHLAYEAQNTAPETLVVEDSAFLENLQRVSAIPLHSTLRPASGWKVVLMVIGFVVAPLFLYGLWKVAIPAMTEEVAMRVPVAWEKKLGETIIEGLPKALAPVADPEKEKVLDAIAERLLKTVPDQPYTIRIYVVPHKLVNAMAFPGGHVVFFQGLLNTAETPEELAGVLAHEIQHVLLRHSTRSIIHSMASQLLLTLIGGDMEGTMNTILGVAGELDGLRHSREMEKEADEKGMQMILAAGIDPSGMIRMFDKLQKEEGIVIGQETDSPSAEEGFEWLEYLSTHPAGNDRVSQLKKQVAKAGKTSYTPLLPDLDWPATMVQDLDAKK